MNHTPLLAVLLLLPALLVGGAIALSPSPAECDPAAPAPGCWQNALGQRLLYIHVPLAWVAYAGFAVAVGAAVAVLARGAPQAGRLMRATTEVTTVYAAGALATGFAWSYEFVFDPLQDPKVLTTMVLVAVLAGLWALAAATPAHRRDELVASLTLVGFVAVPASFLASRLVTPHPDFTRIEQTLSPEMSLLLAVASLGFLLLHAGLTWLRHRTLALEEARLR